MTNQPQKTLCNLQTVTVNAEGLVDGLLSLVLSGDDKGQAAIIPMLDRLKEMIAQLNSDLDCVNRDKLHIEGMDTKPLKQTAPKESAIDRAYTLESFLRVMALAVDGEEVNSDSFVKSGGGHMLDKAANMAGELVTALEKG